MPLGPLFLNESIALARRRRTYRTRMAFGFVLFAVICGRYASFLENGGPRSISVRATASFARSTAETLLLVQAVCVVALVPPLVAGLIAEERQGRTLPDLLTSRLSAFEIVVGKLAARLLSVLTWLAIGLPVLALLGLFGGVEPETVLLAEAATASNAILLGAFTALVSVQARRPRDAVLIVYALGLFWLIVTALVISRPVAAGFVGWAGPVRDWMLRTSPVWIAPPFTILMTVRGGRAFVLAFTPVGDMVLAQAVASMLMLWLAVARLRPASRSLESGPNRRGKRRGIQRRPQVWADAMLWKECHAMGVRRMGERVLMPVAVVLIAAWYFGFLTSPTFEANFWHYYRSALGEFLENGYRAGREGEFAWCRDIWNGQLTAVSAFLSVPWLLAVAAVAATGVSTERERGTWIGLLASPLTSWEILRAKLIGPAWGLWPIFALIAFPWVVGLAMGATHPLGFMFAILGFGVMTWFASALGTFFSIRSKTTTSAMARAVGALAASNLGMIVGLGSSFRSGPTSWILFIPSTLNQLPLSTYAFAGLAGQDPRRLLRMTTDDFLQDAVSGRLCYAAAAVVAANVVFYAILAAILTFASLRALDVEADRPRRSKLSANPR